MLKYILLGILNYSPMTGYDLKQFIDGSTSHFWYAQTSQIYRTLDQLETAGCLRSVIEHQDAKPSKRIYHITEKGRDEMRQWLHEPLDRIPPAKNELLVFLFFAGQLDKDTLLNQLKLQRDQYLQQQGSYDAATGFIKQAVEEQPELARDARLWEATRRFGQIAQQAYLQWLDETIVMIEEEF
ncbi:MAG: PadR family transcriptional regulator [Anaerolineae bacterium]|nr:PadR family transcriptional regulator [Anaerolineae bacterium]